MAEVLGEVGGELFQYNREGWKFGAELRQRDLYQRQKMRIKQVDLYRDDIRDLFELTVGKMDKYVIVCLVMLSITMELFFKGRNPVGTPSWLFWCWSICTAGAMLYLLMSIWLALHASISAQTFSVRCLTQWLRLPIPSAAEIAKGAATLEEYEKSDAGALLRVPVLGKADEKASGLSGTATAHTASPDLTTDWQLFTSHFDLFNRLHRNWQGYEAYSRVCMCLGLNHFLAAMSYFSLAVYALELQSPWAGWAFVTIFQASALLHAKLNLNLSFSESMLMLGLVTVPSLLLSIAVAVTMTAPGERGIDQTKYDLAPCLFACAGILGHIGWIAFFLVQTKSDVNGLPVKFSTVWCIDVLGFGMETLREVQEPVAKPTYITKLPGYSKNGPKNIFDLGELPEDTAEDAAVSSLSRETRESRNRAKLPWLVFKVGSAFTVVLWLMAFVQTIVIPFGVDTGVGTVANRRLASVPTLGADTSSVNLTGITSVRGFVKNVFADEFRLVNSGDGTTVKCTLPDGALIHGISGSPARPVALVRNTWAIVDCASGRKFDSPVDVVVDAIAVRSFPDGSVEIFAVADKSIKYLSLDSAPAQWIDIKDTIAKYSTGTSIGVNSNDELIVLNVKAQKFDRYDVTSGIGLGSTSVKNAEVFWTHTDGHRLSGIAREGKHRVLMDISTI